MPRPSKGARLYQRSDGTFSILDGKIERRTGTSSRAEAESQLAEYIRRRGSPSGPAEPDQISIGDVLTSYVEEHAPHVADPLRIINALDPLTAFWGELRVSAITKNTCRRYAATRVTARGAAPGKTRPIADATIRRELGILRAALRYCEQEGRLTRAPAVHLPDKPQPKDRWLTRNEAARLVRAARHAEQIEGRGKPQARDRARHLAYFILIGLYTGTRKEAILSLAFAPHTSGGWVDVEKGVMYRAAQDMRLTAKRKPPVKMPRKLLGHMRRLKAKGQRWVVQYNGARIADIKTAWARACEAAGIEGATPHTLRHTAITWAMHAGVQLADAAGFFGVSVKVLEEVYLHHHPEFQNETAAAMNRA